MAIDLTGSSDTTAMDLGKGACCEATEPCYAVALAAFDGVSWLDEQLDSILAQEGVRVQIFVSVDPSSDGTEQLVANRVIQDPRIIMLPQYGRFQNAARNFYRLVCDINLAGFNYLAFSDQDDIWLPDKLLRAHTLLQQGNYAAYSSNVTAFWPDGRQQFIDKSQPIRSKDFLFEAAGPGSTYVFNSVLAQNLQNFIAAQRSEIDQVALHDWFFYAFARSKGYRWIIDSRSGLMYRQHATNHLGVNAGFAAYKNRFKAISSGWYRAEILKITTLFYSQEVPFLKALKAGGWHSRLFLMKHIKQCRRHWLDRVALFLCCLFGLF